MSLNSSKIHDHDSSSKLKRKNDDDLNSDSNSQNSDSSKSNDQSLKKIKIPIKLSVQMNSAKAKPIENESSQGKSTNIAKTESSVKDSIKAPVAKLPTGNLAPSKKQPLTVVKNVSEKVASVFGIDSDDETEEMPMEAKMKMRNIGRDTPTSTGPNSYGKTGNLGFVDQRKLFEKQLKEKAEELLKQEEGTINK